MENRLEGVIENNSLLIECEITADNNLLIECDIISSGAPGYTPRKGIDYFDGESISITSVEPTEETQNVTFSDGTEISIPNGKKGEKGDDGDVNVDALTIEEIDEILGW